MTTNFLESAALIESLPLNSITKYSGNPSRNGVVFTGHPRQHPAEKHKLILVCNPLGDNPRVMEFKIEDVVYAEEYPAAVSEAGETTPMIKLWIRKGARGVLLEPFEVDEPIRFVNREGRGRYLTLEDSDRKRDESWL